MAIQLKNKYPAQVIDSDPGYPYGRPKNETAPGLKNGTPLEEAWVSDVEGFLQALLVRAGITPSGTPDNVLASQYLDAIDKRFGTTGDLVGSNYEAIAGAPTAHVLDPTSQDSNVTCACFGNNGAFAYVAGGNAIVYRYELGEPYNLNTATHSGNLYNVGTGISAEQIDSLHFTPDGTICIMAGYNSSGAATMYQISMTTPWDLSSVTVGTSRASSEWANTHLNCVTYKPSADGTILHASGRRAGDSVSVIAEYSLSTAYSIGTATVTPFIYEFAALESGESARAHAFDGTGTRLFLVTGPYIREYKLTGDHTIDSITNIFRKRDVLGIYGSNLTSIAFSGNGNRAIYSMFLAPFVVSQYSSVVRYA